jgi:hypothetical protein
MLTLTHSSYSDKVHGGWLGKLIGTAVGRQSDGQRLPGEATGYPGKLSEVPAVWGEGTDFQAVWLRVLQTAGPKVTDDDLIGGWLRHISHAEGEYAHARANFRRGVNSPISGAYDNPFRESLGGLARAEMWGMLTPGDPEQAAWFARRDAMLDHAGAGIESAIWLAGMVSAGFVETDVARLIETGLRLIPEAGRVGRAVRDVFRWHGEHAHWGRTREMLLRSYGSDDLRDSVVAAGFVALALLQGRGDFARSVLSAASCGWSAAVTSGAVGAVLGVVLGERALPADWRASLQADAEVSSSVVGVPRSLPRQWMADQICEIGRIVVRSESGGRVQFAPEPAEADPSLPAPDASNLLRQLAIGPYVTAHRRGPLRIQVDYDARPTIGYDLPRRLTVALSNTANRTLEAQARLAAPAGFVVAAAAESLTLPEGTMVSFVLTVTAPRGMAVISPSNPFTLHLALDDGSEFTLPVTLVGESLWYASGPYGSFDEAHLPEDAALLSGERSLETDGWRRLSVPEPAVSVVAGLEGEQGTYYLASDVRMPMAVRARLRIASNDGIRAWLNGGEVWYQHEHRAASPLDFARGGARLSAVEAPPLSADECDANLRQGWNRLVIKMAQCTPRRYLAVTFRDTAGQLLLEAENTEVRGR